jgi:hypothetical protein
MAWTANRADAVRTTSGEMKSAEVKRGKSESSPPQSKGASSWCHRGTSVLPASYAYLQTEVQSRQLRASCSTSPRPSPQRRGRTFGGQATRPKRTDFSMTGLGDSLSPRERVGVWGNGAYEHSQHAVEPEIRMSSSILGRSRLRPARYAGRHQTLTGYGRCCARGRARFDPSRLWCRRDGRNAPPVQY